MIYVVFDYNKGLEPPCCGDRIVDISLGYARPPQVDPPLAEDDKAGKKGNSLHRRAGVNPPEADEFAPTRGMLG